tara:strand:+ start:244 stop:750 length:507 start_codon:yes stop_codon:yes gene_type:complete
MLGNYLVHHSGFSRSLQRRHRGGYPFLFFHRDIEEVFDRAFRGFGAPATDDKESRPTLLSPRVNVVETDNGYIFTAELPGLDKNELKVELNDGILSIGGKKNAGRDDKGGNFHVAERSYGTFKRSFHVPTDVNIKDIDAAFKNGVLTVSLPKKEKAKATVKTIDVKAS